MGGLDWNGLPVVCEMLGIDDPQRLIVQLATLRDWQRDNPAE